MGYMYYDLYLNTDSHLITQVFNLAIWTRLYLARLYFCDFERKKLKKELNFAKALLQ